MDKKSISLKKTQAHHEGERSGPSGQAGRLRVEKQGLSEVQFLKPFIFREKMGGISRNVKDFSQGHLTISKVRRKIFLRLKGLSFRGRNDLSFDQFSMGTMAFFW